MEKEDSSVETKVKTAVCTTKKATKKRRYDNPHKWYEGRKLIIHRKAPLQESGREIHCKLQKKLELKNEMKGKRKTQEDIRTGDQKTITSMFLKK